MQRHARRLSIRGSMRIQVLTDKFQRAELGTTCPMPCMRLFALMPGAKSNWHLSECKPSSFVCPTWPRAQATSPPTTNRNTESEGGVAAPDGTTQAAHGAFPACLPIASRPPAPAWSAPAILPVAGHSAADLDHTKAIIEHLCVHTFCLNRKQYKNTFMQ